MIKIKVHSPFRFTPVTGETQDFEEGVHHVSEDVAKHWFIQAHAEIVGATEEGIQADYDAELTELRAAINKLTQTLEERDKQITELKQQLKERDNHIADLLIQGDPSNGGKNGGSKK
ncbi:STY1053 family phage-associated protein [Xenorhabdus cabanillasii]|uniref:Bacteriophage protein n=1 Tax=Xenorhabdus cabanillasii JM26 TaxID=1427517 RepID=W1IND4_9GAMM|nr:hypothetical protein [Xenorhabdus cabanillasii]PHM76953.1 hypothetical protein Xcab_02520 [Xenorhabdus cabanillasii JM26]CDL79924.1 hypothetical protein XCR1_1290022 [Xenorhabdus cabanillasii JM26]